MWIERLMAGISHQHVLSYNPKLNISQAAAPKRCRLFRESQQEEKKYPTRFHVWTKESGGIFFLLLRPL